MIADGNQCTPHKGTLIGSNNHDFFLVKYLPNAKTYKSNQVEWTIHAYLRVFYSEMYIL